MTFDRLRRIVRLRLRSLTSASLLDRELDEELRDHLERQVVANLAAGMTRQQARRAALLAIGGVEQCKEQMRDTRGVARLENLWRDVRLSFRQLRKEPGFTATAILSLALGIGANTAIFQLLNALSFSELPVRAPGELVELRLTGEGRDGRHNGRNRQVSLPQYQEFSRRQNVFSSMLAFGDTRFNLAGSGEVRYVDGLWVSGTFFETLGVRPLLGRLISAGDDQPGCAAAPVAVISYALWQSEFGGRPDVVGQSLPWGGGTRAAGRATIIGVTPAAFFGVEVGRQFGAALPICASGFTRRDHWWLAAVGRLKPGVTVRSAEMQLAQLLATVQAATLPQYTNDLANEYLGMKLELASAAAGLSPLRRSYQRPLGILLGISALVLLIASVNLANLLLARATARHNEFAVRLALGGTRRRILQQVLTESALLAALGSAAAILVALGVSRAIPALISTATDQIHLDVSLDWRVFGFTAALAIAAAIIFGSAPAIRASRAALRGVTRGGSGNEGLALRRGLVAIQIAVTLVLIFSGLLFVRTFRNLAAADTGVHQRNIVSAAVFFRAEEYPEPRRAAAYAALDDALAHLPGVESIADAYTVPLGGSVWDTDVAIDGVHKGDAYGNRVGPGYFRTLGTPLLAGRDIDRRDQPDTPLVAVVNQAFADKYLPGDPVGRYFTLPDSAGGIDRTFQVIGLVGEQKYVDLREARPPIFYTASAQESPLPTTRRYVIRAAQSPPETIAAVSAAVMAFDPSLALRSARLDTQIAEGMLQERLMARLSALFGGLALLLAAIGLYGIVSYTVASRRAEIGVRVALGASRLRILKMILGDAGRILIAGVCTGGVLALAAGRTLGALLYGLGGDDVGTLLVAAGVMAGVGIIAALWPARRATGIDPVTALREM